MGAPLFPLWKGAKKFLNQKKKRKCALFFAEHLDCEMKKDKQQANFSNSGDATQSHEKKMFFHQVTSNYFLQKPS